MNKKIIISLAIAVLLIVGVWSLMSFTKDDNVKQQTQSMDVIENSETNDIVDKDETGLIPVNNESEENTNESVDATTEVSDKDVESLAELEKLVQQIDNELNKTSDNKKATNGEVVSKQYEPNMIYYLDKSVPYKNGGKTSGTEIIKDKKHASTWGGAETFSGTDKMNTHFIGYAGSQFKDVQNATEFIITDGQGTPFKYKVVHTYETDEYGIGLEDGIDYLQNIIGTHGGERIVIQTSTGNRKEKHIIEALFIE